MTAKYFDTCPKDGDTFPVAGMHVHRRDNSGGTLVVFIHGWGGEGYGTWRGIPSAVYQATPGADVALVDYPSGCRRLRSESTKLDGTVDYIVQELTALAAVYTDFLLVGHSMGGVVAAAVLRRSHELGLSVHERTLGMLSIASPRAGIKWIPFAARPIRDSPYLAAHAEVHRRNFEFFTNLVDITPHVGSTESFHIPHNVAIATHDRIVNRMSSSGDLPRAHITHFVADHSRILARPDVENWVLENLIQFVNVRSEARRRAQHGQRKVVTRFKGHATRGEWQDAYRNALREFGEREKVLVLDDTARMSSDQLGLMVRVVRCEDVANPELQDELRLYAERQDRREITAFGISPFGSNSDLYTEQVLSVVGDAENRWIKATSSTHDLRTEIVRWLSRLHAPGEPVAYGMDYHPTNRGVATALGPDRGVFYE